MRMNVNSRPSISKKLQQQQNDDSRRTNDNNNRIAISCHCRMQQQQQQQQQQSPPNNDNNNAKKKQQQRTMMNAASASWWRIWIIISGVSIMVTCWFVISSWMTLQMRSFRYFSDDSFIRCDTGTITSITNNISIDGTGDPAAAGDNSNAATTTTNLIDNNFPSNEFASLRATYAANTRMAAARSSSSSNAEDDPKGDIVYPAPYPPPATTDGTTSVQLAIRPSHGHHRLDENAIFAVGTGFGIDVYVRFVSSLLEANYTGDIVLGVGEGYSLEIREYFQYHAACQQNHLVVYDIPMKCYGPRGQEVCRVNGMFQHSHNGSDTALLDDTRSLREIAQLRYEYYWAWTTRYSESSNIWFLDCRDVHFQRHPFTYLLGGEGDSRTAVPAPDDNNKADGPTTTAATSMKTTLHVYEETALIPLGEQSYNRDWIEAAYGKTWVERLSSNVILCSGSTAGGQPAMNLYARAMVHQWDVTQCPLRGCDQGHHNFLVGSGRLLRSRDRAITKIVSHKQGEGTVNTMAVLLSKSGSNLTEAGILNGKTNQVLNNDGSVSPIIHQFDRNNELKQIVKLEGERMLEEWNRRKAAAAAAVTTP